MPTVTKIAAQRRAANRRSVHLDGAFAFGCNVNVVARFRLREGVTLSAAEVDQILVGEVRQECFDAALRSIQSRLHGRAELKKKLMKKEWGEATIDGVLNDLARLGYVDDVKFALARATTAAKVKHHGRRRAMIELARKGVGTADAGKALERVYADHDSAAAAMALGEKQAARLRSLDLAVARRRLTGLLQRRGFDFDAIRPVLDRILGRGNGPDYD